jgi:predicted nucleic acid-binding protein
VVADRSFGHLGTHPAIRDLDQSARGRGEKLGEASVLAITEELQEIAIVDDRDATRVGRAYGIDVHGTVWLLGRSCGDGKLTEVAAGNLIDALAATGMRLPCTGAEFPAFARKHGLLQS